MKKTLFSAHGLPLEEPDLSHSMEVLFPEYFHTTEPYYGIVQKLWKLDFPTFFYNILKYFPTMDLHDN